jgi:hypothetical protein
MNPVYPSICTAGCNACVFEHACACASVHASVGRTVHVGARMCMHRRILPSLSPKSITTTLLPSLYPIHSFADVQHNDLNVYDPDAGAWTDLSAAISGTPPSPRDDHGFTSAGGKLYVHGGYGTRGERGAERAEGLGGVGAEAGRRDVSPRDWRRGGQVSRLARGRREGRRADEGAPSVRPSAG